MSIDSHVRLRVLILGGWSPGPLDSLRWAVRDECIDFFEPAMHMPPAGFRWCLTWEAVLLAMCAWVLIGVAPGLPLLQRCAFVLACVSALPVAVVLVE